MNLQSYIKMRGTVVLLLTLSFFMHSCKKEDQAPVIGQEGTAKVIINLLGTASTTDMLQGVKSARVASMSASANKAIYEDVYSEEIQEQVVQLDDGLTVIATLAPEDETVKSISAISRGIVASATQIASPMMAAAGDIERNVLGTGVRYKVIAYNADGSFKAEQDYRYGSSETTVGLALDSEKTYTFVVYSVNSTTVLPAVTGTTLATAKLTAVTGDLMYFQKKMKVTAGDNFLDVILRHKFSQITTTIEMSPETRGNLISINSTVFNPTRANADFKLSDSVITFGAVKTGGTPVVFPAIDVNGVRSIMSTPTLLLSPATTNATFSIGATTTTGHLAATSRTNSTILSGFKINPGRKYNLKLKMVIPCAENVGVVGSDNIFNWDSRVSGQYPGTRTLTAPSADFGFVFDITELDNSFNMRINGPSSNRTKLLATGPENNTNNELQFEEGVINRPRNIKFADGGVWGAGSVDDIWEIKGTSERPALRLVISAEGKVSMYGSKVSGGELFPLVLETGWSFNTITWNKTAPNTIVISQHIQNVTVMKGSGYGKKKLATCP